MRVASYDDHCGEPVRCEDCIFLCPVYDADGRSAGWACTAIVGELRMRDCNARPCDMFEGAGYDC